MKYPVERGVPIPEKSKYRGGRAPSGLAYPFADMATGDSFFVPAASSRGATLNRVILAARKYAKKIFSETGWQMEFTARTLVDEETGNVAGVRCWRVK